MNINAAKKVIKSALWLIVSLLALQVIKIVLSRHTLSWTFLGVIVCGCVQFFLAVSFIGVWVCSWILKRAFSVRRPLTIALCVVGTGIAGMECVLAWWMYHPEHLPVPARPAYGYYYDYFQEDLLQFDKRYAVYDSGLFYTLKPGSSFVFDNIEFSTNYRTNRLGLRGEDSALSTAEVACIGDSYTMGWGVEEDQSFPSKLKVLSGLRVANMGMASYGTAREIKGLGRLDTSRLRWLVIQYCCNDQDENRTSIEHGYKLPISPPDTYEQLTRSARGSRIYFPGKYFLIIGNYFLKSQLNRIYPFFSLRWERRDWGKDQEGQARAFLDVLYHSSIDFGKMHVIITMMDDAVNMRGSFLAAVRRLSQLPPYKERFGPKLFLLDAGALLSEGDRYILDVHFRASGHEKIARALSEIIERGANRN